PAGRAADDVGLAVAVDVPGRDRDAAGVLGVEGQVALQQAAVGAGEDLDLAAAALGQADDEVGVAVAVDVPGRDVDAAGVVQRPGRETVEQGQVGAAEDLDVGAAAGPGAGDDVGDAVAVDVADRHPPLAGEARVVGGDPPQEHEVAGPEEADDRAGRGGDHPGADPDLGLEGADVGGPVPRPGEAAAALVEGQAQRVGPGVEG